MTTVDRLHYLVHPGWGIVGEKVIEERDRVMFQRYQKVAEGLSEEEVMMTLLVYPTCEQGSLPDAFVYQQICQLKETLRQRLVVLSGGMRLLTDPKKLRADTLRAKEIFERRGYIIQPSTLCMGFGETFLECVPNACRQLRDAYQLVFDPIVRAHYTNQGVRDSETPAEERARFKEIAQFYDFSNVTIDWTVPDQE